MTAFYLQNVWINNQQADDYGRLAAGSTSSVLSERR